MTFQMKWDTCDDLTNYVLQLGDDALVLGHRLSEWCGHGPILEQDIALSNISLDLIGLARQYYQYAAELIGDDMTEDHIAYLRDVGDFHNHSMMEQPNGHWGDTLVRQCLYDVFHQDYLTALTGSSDQRLAAIAVKALKEVNYHVQFSSEWLIRLGDGTQESHDKVQNSLQDLMTYSAEFFQASKAEAWALTQGVGPDVAALKPRWDNRMDTLISQATLNRPAADAAIWQGKEGSHGEFLALLLSEMQSLPRSYPDATW